MGERSFAIVTGGSAGTVQDTAMFAELGAPGSEREAALAKSVPVGRLGRSDDVARAVMFFTAREHLQHPPGSQCPRRHQRRQHQLLG